jgi:hypothetical protein
MYIECESVRRGGAGVGMHFCRGCNCDPATMLLLTFICK